MTQALDLLTETPSQTAGPYVHIGCLPRFAGLGDIYPEDLGTSPIGPGARGQVITIRGTVYDRMGAPVRDAMIESWQPDGAGRFPGEAEADPAVNGFCRFAADETTGEFSLSTVMPGAVRLRDGRPQAPHIALWIAARGINTGLQTRIYFEDTVTDDDPLLSRIEQPARKDTLIAKKEAAGIYRFDIRLSGEGETVFLDL